MDDAYLSAAVQQLRDALPAAGGARIAFASGLRPEEIGHVEVRFGIRFPPDLRALLAFALPVAPGFPNWRGPADALAAQLSAPGDGILFDVEFNGFWLAQWGPRPPDRGAALAVARERVAATPILVPIYGHRYVPSEPHVAGNPVLSVVQSDVILYGYDLADYLWREFGVPRPPWARSAPRPIPFWTDLVSGER